MVVDTRRTDGVRPQVAGAELEITVLGPQEWERLRDLRCQALTEDLDSFYPGSQSDFGASREAWIDRLERSVCVAARVDGVDVGLAWLVEGEEPDTRSHIEAVWVCGNHRRLGVATALIQGLVMFAVDRGDEVLLWIMADNGAARGFYGAFGFVPTGETKPTPGGRFEERFRLGLSGRRDVVAATDGTASAEAGAEALLEA